MGSHVLIICFVVVVIGGIGSVKGAMAASLMIGLAETFGQVLVPEVAGMIVYVLMADRARLAADRPVRQSLR